MAPGHGDECRPPCRRLLGAGDGGGRRQGARGRSGGGRHALKAEQRQVAELAERDREVRAHEMCMSPRRRRPGDPGRQLHLSARTAQRYAIGGEVGIDTSPGRSPEESLSKAERIRAAALAPAEPSGQDRQVAAQASRMASDARMEIARREFEQGGAGTEAAATRDGPGYRGMRAAQAYSAALAPGQGPTLSATA
ncbi:MAG: hypothetical protein KF731_05110 [Thauera sp.]|nr:hypothetical protein [Thauera sp.]